MVYYFNKGGPLMWVLLGLLVVGIVIAIVKFIILTLASINSEKFLNKILSLLKANKVEDALKICEKTRGPVSAVFHAGISRLDKGLEAAERAMENAAAIEVAFLESGLIWLSTIVSVAPMIGFLGTVQGMIVAFEQIARSNDIIPSEVAGGISTALLTTFGGLTVAIPLQIIYNYFVQRIDKMVVDTEDSANNLVESLLEMKLIKKKAE
ncbi:MAG: flagellar motor protein MotA [candidate division Zixibacteria bacterium 4484_93]|nr:MAG: flagellar motor protein MotA [candidate division Zixibacteria bacterium 4484_93]